MEKLDRQYRHNTLGKADKGSKAKAEAAHKRTERQVEEISEVPTNDSGRPLVKIQFAASELLPTGQYANVSIGPCQVTAYVDLDREIGDEETTNYFTEEERAIITHAANELADLIEVDVIGVQRSLVLSSLQKED